MKNGKILVVDDHEEIHLAIRMFLKLGVNCMMELKDVTAANNLPV